MVNFGHSGYMLTQIPDLWPDDFGQPDKPTPVSILKQQGVYLGQKTKNVVIGQVRSIPGANVVRHYFELSAPLMGYNIDLFSVEHNPIEPYPLEINSRGGGLGPSGKATTPEEFLELPRTS